MILKSVCPNVFTGNNAALTTLTYPTHLSPIQIHSVTTSMDDQIHVWKSTHRKVRFKRTRTTQQLRQLKGANHWNKFVCHGILTTILFKELKVECCSRNFWRNIWRRNFQVHISFIISSKVLAWFLEENPLVQ